MKEEIARKTAQREGIQKTYEAFMKVSGGKQFVFCQSEEEVRDFLFQKMEYKEKEEMQLPEMDAQHGLVLMVSPHTGIHIQMRLCECIFHRRTSFMTRRRHSGRLSCSS